MHFLLHPNGFKNMFLFLIWVPFFLLISLVFTAPWIVARFIIFISPFVKQETIQWGRLKSGVPEGARGWLCNFLNVSCFRSSDLTFSATTAGLTDHHTFLGTVRSALHSWFHSVVRALQSRERYHPHFAKEELPQGHTASTWQGYSPGPTLWAKSVLSAGVACNTSVFRGLCAQTWAGFLRLRISNMG